MRQSRFASPSHDALHHKPARTAGSRDRKLGLSLKGSACEPSSRGYSPPAAIVDVRPGKPRQEGWQKGWSESRTLREEIKMSLTRRQALASAAAAAIAST